MLETCNFPLVALPELGSTVFFLSHKIALRCTSIFKLVIVIFSRHAILFANCCPATDLHPFILVFSWKLVVQAFVLLLFLLKSLPAICRHIAMGTRRSALWYFYHRKDRCDRHNAGGWSPYDRNDRRWVTTITEIELAILGIVFATIAAIAEERFAYERNDRWIRLKFQGNNPGKRISFTVELILRAYRRKFNLF